MTLTPPQAALLRDLLPEGRYAVAQPKRFKVYGPRFHYVNFCWHADMDGLLRHGLVGFKFNGRIFTVTPAGREYARLNFSEVTP